MSLVDKVDTAAGQVTLDLGGGRSYTYEAPGGVDVSPLKAGDTVKGIYAKQLSIKVLSMNPLKPKSSSPGCLRQRGVHPCRRPALGARIYRSTP